MSHIHSIYNLKKDRNVQGKKWLRTYNNYFSDDENIRSFVQATLPYLPKKHLNILYVASASGVLGEALVKAHGNSSLTLVDISKKHLAENKNTHTKKICCDILDLSMKEQFDCIIMRSSLDYFSSRKVQVSVLKIIKKHLTKKGIFVNQPAYISNKNDRKKISKAYTDTEKIGNRLFQSSDLCEIYRDAGFLIYKHIGDAKKLVLTEKEHMKRYGIDHTDILHIQKILKGNSDSIMRTQQGYKLTFDFPIFLAQ